jgi:4-amino-4-deoxy-L-arabinose transferase-like glycosyltransferase
VIHFKNQHFCVDNIAGHPFTIELSIVKPASNLLQIKMIKENRFFQSLGPIKIFSALILIVSWGAIIATTQKWNQAKGYEYEWIALSLASGNGYSFDENTAWLGPYESLSGYVSTAWSEPIPVVILAFFLKVFGQYGRLLLVMLNIAWLAGTCLLVYFIGKRISGAITGYISIALFLILLFFKSEQITYIGNTSLGCFLISLCALALLNMFASFTIRNITILGITLGLTHLTHAGSILFTLIALIFIAINTGNNKFLVVRNMAILLMTLSITISPWIVRNYLVFDQLVPIRNGFGWQLYLGTIGLSPKVTSNLGIEYQEQNSTGLPIRTYQAVEHFKNLEYEITVRNYLFTDIQDRLPENYSSFNEAQRDRVYLENALTFILQNPIYIIKLMLWKYVAFFNWGISTWIITLMTFLGLLVGFRNIKVLVIMFLILAYTVPYVFSIPLYYRYRFTIEPLMVILGAVFLNTIIEFIFKFLHIRTNKVSITSNHGNLHL